MNTQPGKMCCACLFLFIRIWVGIRILREVKGENFADDAISLLLVEYKKNLLIDGIFPMRSIFFYFY